MGHTWANHVGEERGTMYGNFMVLGYAFNEFLNSGRNDQYRCLCVVCACGNLCIKHKNKLKRGDTTSCGCRRSVVGAKNPNWRGHENIPMEYYNRARTGAEKRGIQFCVSIEHISDLLNKQNFMCALTGVKLTAGSLRGHGVFDASLDRVDSAKGYVEGNLQWVHKAVNKMKLDHSQQEFIELCTLVALHAGTVRPLDE